jgi:hypothetical protein
VSAAPGPLARVVAWLRAGYPTGVPDRDYVALLALLRRRLTDDEVADVARELVASGTLRPDQVDIGVAVSKVTGDVPSEDDVRRVQVHLARSNDPLA